MSANKEVKKAAAPTDIDILLGNYNKSDLPVVDINDLPPLPPAPIKQKTPEKQEPEKAKTNKFEHLMKAKMQEKA